ncbi:hypothetical protein AB0I81_39075 [Nonomuraea sp. NPDC050404]|uniref:hypothetical protein n=1 Tax=Nonomuraea sp. NPDC050404 TaxID=3155783 RepID=UPI0033C706A0
MWTKDGPARGSQDAGAASPADRLTTVASRGLPSPARERKPALAALAVLLILGGALATMVLIMRADERVSAILITKRIGAGQALDPGSMRETRVVEDGVTYELWAHREQVSRTVAAATLLPGTVVTTDMTVAWNQELVPGKARVGLALKPGQMPNAVQAGQRVQVVLVQSGGTGATGQGYRVLAQSALVESSVVSNNRATAEVTVVVDGSVAPEIAAHASAGRIVITELPGAR